MAQLKVSKEANGIIQLWKTLKTKSMQCFTAMQADKEQFVKNYDPDNYKAYYEFRRSMDELQKKRDEFNNMTDYIEQYVKNIYSIDLFYELVVKQKEVVVED